MSKKVLIVSTIIWIVMAIAFVLGVNFDEPVTCGISVVVFSIAYLAFLAAYANMNERIGK